MSRSFFDTFRCESNGFIDKVVVHDAIDRAGIKCRRRFQRFPRQHQIHRFLCTDEARQSLRAGCAGQQPEIDLRQSNSSTCQRDSVVATERGLEAAAERRAVNRGNDRLLAGIDLAHDIRQEGLERRLAEFLDICAGDERPPGAGNNYRLAGIIRLSCGN